MPVWRFIRCSLLTTCLLQEWSWVFSTQEGRKNRFHGSRSTRQYAGQFFGSYEAIWVQTWWPPTKAECQHSIFACPNFDWLIYFPYSFWGHQITQCQTSAQFLGNPQLSWFNLEIFLVLSWWRVYRELRTFSSIISLGKKGKTKVGMELWLLYTSHKFGHICVGFFLTPFPTSAPNSVFLCFKY